MIRLAIPGVPYRKQIKQAPADTRGVAVEPVQHTAPIPWTRSNDNPNGVSFNVPWLDGTSKVLIHVGEPDEHPWGLLLRDRFHVVAAALAALDRRVFTPVDHITTVISRHLSRARRENS